MSNDDLQAKMMEIHDDLMAHVGDSEFNDMPEIQQWIKETSGNIHREAWCSDGMNHFVKKHGLPGTGSAAAISWLKWGVSAGDTTFPGCILVFEWSGGSDAGGHHVTMMAKDQSGTDADTIACIGCNQGNEVKVSIFPLADIMDDGIRMPDGWEVQQAA